MRLLKGGRGGTPSEHEDPHEGGGGVQIGHEDASCLCNGPLGEILDRIGVSGLANQVDLEVW